MPRLTLDQWQTIRAEREAGASFPELAAKHGVSHQAIQKRAKTEGWEIPIPKLWLSADQWVAIRAEREAGASFPELAKKYCVSHQAIQKRAKQEGWNIPAPKLVASIDELVERRKRYEEQRALRRQKEKEARERLKALDAQAKKIVHLERVANKVDTVYIVYCEHGGQRWHKIGVTANMQARLPVIQSGCPLPIKTLIACEVKAARHIERVLHERFSARRVSGEWFSLSDEDVAAAIDALTAAVTCNVRGECSNA